MGYDVDPQANMSVDEVLFTRLKAHVRNVDFVLDNIIAAIHPGSDIAEGTCAFLACCVIHVLLSNMRKLGLIPERVIQSKWYDGVFLRLDSKPYMRNFIVRFLKSVRRNTKIPKIRYVVLDPEPPVHFNKLLGCNVVVTRDSVQLNGKEYKIGGHVGVGVNADEGQVVYPHSKQEFYAHVLKEVKGGKDSKDLWTLNFLRDCYRADVAVEKNTFYVTHDRLAFLYYKLIGGKLGMFLEVKNQGQADIHYRVSI